MGVAILNGNIKISFGFYITKYYVGNININDRIFVDRGLVKVSYPDKYQILPYSIANDYENKILTLTGIDCNENTVHAKIDGVEYEGFEIIVDGLSVYVNGILVQPKNIELPVSENIQRDDTTSIALSSAALFATDKNSSVDHLNKPSMPNTLEHHF